MSAYVTPPATRPSTPQAPRKTTRSSNGTLGSTQPRNLNPEFDRAETQARLAPPTPEGQRVFNARVVASLSRFAAMNDFENIEL